MRRNVSPRITLALLAIIVVATSFALGIVSFLAYRKLASPASIITINGTVPADSSEPIWFYLPEGW